MIRAETLADDELLLFSIFNMLRLCVCVCVCVCVCGGIVYECLGIKA